MNAPGKSFINVSSIIFIVISGSCYFVSVTTLLSAVFIFRTLKIQAEASQPLEYYEALTNSGVLFAGTALALAGTATYLLVTGILGLKNAGKPEKSKSQIILGIITAVLCAFWLVFSYAPIEKILSCTIFIVFITYTVGAVKNNNALKEYSKPESMSLSQAMFSQVAELPDAVSETLAEGNKEE